MTGAFRGHDAALAERLASMPASELTTLLLDVMGRRAASMSPSEVMDRYRTDRFAPPSPAPLTRLREVESAFLDAFADFDPIALSPVVPTGMHSVVGRVSQNNVLTTIRTSDLAADPTAGLALEAAARRAPHIRDRSSIPIDIATVQRVVRTQRFSGTLSYAHFSLFAAVTAARDTGSMTFELETVVRHLSATRTALLACGAKDVQIAVADLGGGERICAHIAETLPDVTRREDDRRDYYRMCCYKIRATFRGTTIEVGDGGFVDWTQQLLSSEKERCLTTGVSLERIAMVTA